jgi:hypothetical protein
MDESAQPTRSLDCDRVDTTVRRGHSALSDDYWHSDRCGQMAFGKNRTLSQDAFEVASAETEDPVDAPATSGANGALGDRVSHGALGSEP